MTGVVVDASVTLAWGIPDEASDYAETVLVALEGRTLLVPTLWSLEITNAIVIAERRKRLKPQDIRRFVELLGGFRIVEHSSSFEETITHILPLARAHDLSAYDATYLELAHRQHAPLATLDTRLRKAARSASVDLFDA